jgi:hypothetical protein
VVSAGLLIVIIVSIIVGGLTGMALGSLLSGTVLAIIAGFLAVIASVAVRNLLMVRGAGAGPDDSGLPGLIIVFAIIASLAGSLSAEEITEHLLHLSQGMRGALAGLLSGVLMAMLMITYHMNPDKRSNRIPN